MPNILLTEVCNRRCPYCFAQQAMAHGQDRFLSFAELVRIADGLVEARIPRVGVLGGEPTLHPDCVDVVHYLLARGLRVTVFTNGLAAERTVRALAAIDRAAAVGYVVNVNFPEITPEREAVRQRAFLTALGARCEIGLNLYRVDLDPCFVAAMGAALGTSRRVRLGLAQPIVDAGNEFLPMRFYREAAPRVVELVRACFDGGGSVHFDCGFPLCMFDDAQLGALRRCGTTLRFNCEPALDLAPGGRSWACFPLAESHARPWPRGEGLVELRRRHRDAMQGSRDAHGVHGIFRECEACAYRKARQCDGGCLAHALRGRLAT